MLLAGCQLDRTNFVIERHQGHVATQGVTTVLPFQLENYPFSEYAVWFFLSGRICINGRDFSVDIPNRRISWLASAPFGILVGNWIEVQYWVNDNV